MILNAQKATVESEFYCETQLLFYGNALHWGTSLASAARSLFRLPARGSNGPRAKPNRRSPKAGGGLGDRIN